MAQSKGLELIKAIVQRTLAQKSYDHRSLQKINFLTAGSGRVTAEFTVDDEHTNSGGTLHGGCTSTLIDAISTYALMTQGKGVAGVSIDLNVSFLKGAVPGDVISIDAKTIKAGKTLAFLEVEMTRKKDGAIIARGQQTKFIGF